MYRKGTPLIKVNYSSIWNKIKSNFAANQASMQTKPETKREAVWLGLLLLVGLGGLAVLQWRREQTPTAAPLEKVAVQQQETPTSATPVQPAVQAIPGNFMAVNDDAEAGSPYTFRIQDFSKDITYLVDFGDATRATMQNGQARHTYKKMGQYNVHLYALYQGDTLLLKTMQKKVGRPIEREKVAPAIDY